MKTQNRLRILSNIYVLLSAFSLLSVGVMAFFNPQAVMDLVQVKLPNTDAYSSIRGVYGGVGFTLVIALLYTLRKSVQQSLAFLAIFWGFYAVSRFLTILTEGALGEFGTRWLGIETFFCAAACTLLLLNRRATKQVIYTKA